MRANKDSVVDYYLAADRWLRKTEYADELNWQNQLCFDEITESQFLREHAWVVLNSGFRESVVRRYFDYISLSFCDWESAREIVKFHSECSESAYVVFKNKRKISAIVEMSQRIEMDGFEFLKSEIRNDAHRTLMSLPFVGSITAWHLAKNLGLDVAKPDRHLVRLAGRFGYECVHRMCDEISREVGQRVAVVDLVLWRFEERRLNGAAI